MSRSGRGNRTTSIVRPGASLPLVPSPLVRMVLRRAGGWILRRTPGWVLRRTGRRVPSPVVRLVLRSGRLIRKALAIAGVAMLVLPRPKGGALCGLLAGRDGSRDRPTRGTASCGLGTHTGAADASLTQYLACIPSVLRCAEQGVCACHHLAGGSEVP